MSPPVCRVVKTLIQGTGKTQLSAAWRGSSVSRSRTPSSNSAPSELVQRAWSGPHPSRSDVPQCMRSTGCRHRQPASAPVQRSARRRRTSPNDGRQAHCLQRRTSSTTGLGNTGATRRPQTALFGHHSSSPERSIKKPLSCTNVTARHRLARPRVPLRRRERRFESCRGALRLLGHFLHHVALSAARSDLRFAMSHRRSDLRHYDTQEPTRGATVDDLSVLGCREKQATCRCIRPKLVCLRRKVSIVSALSTGVTGTAEESLHQTVTITGFPRCVTRCNK